MLGKITLLVIIALMFLSIIPNLSFAAEEKTKITFQVSILDVDPINQIAKVQFVIQAYPVYATNDTIWARVGGMGDLSMQLKKIDTNNYQGVSNITQWGIYGNPEDYPFDSYYSNFTITHIDHVWSAEINQEWSSISFQGEKTKNLANLWKITEVYAVLPIKYLDPPRLGMVPTFGKREQFGVPIMAVPTMLPVWIAFAFLGASFFIRADDLANRLLVYTSIFVFAPVFLFSIQPGIPNRLLLSHVEVQVLILISVVGILGIGSMITHRLRNTMKQLYFDLAAIGISEISVLSVASPYLWSNTGLSWGIVLVFLPLVALISIIIRSHTNLLRP